LALVCHTGTRGWRGPDGRVQCVQSRRAVGGDGGGRLGVRGLGHLHLLEGEDSEAGEGGDAVGEGGHGAAVEDQLLQTRQPPRLLRQPPQLVVLPPPNGVRAGSAEV
jgi:hypothetical protein